VLQGHQPLTIPTEVVSPEAQEVAAEPTEVAEPQENGENSPEKPGESPPAVAEVTAALEACQVEEKAEATKEEVAAQPSPSVQVEASSSNE